MREGRPGEVVEWTPMSGSDQEESRGGVDAGGRGVRPGGVARRSGRGGVNATDDDATPGMGVAWGWPQIVGVVVWWWGAVLRCRGGARGENRGAAAAGGGI